MTTKRHGTISTPGELRFERFFNSSIEKIWSYLTESEKRGKWHLEIPEANLKGITPQNFRVIFENFQNEY